MSDLVKGVITYLAEDKYVFIDDRGRMSPVLDRDEAFNYSLEAQPGGNAYERLARADKYGTSTISGDPAESFLKKNTLGLCANGMRRRLLCQAALGS